jgi:serine/threonine-protein kinase HipA
MPGHGRGCYHKERRMSYCLICGKKCLENNTLHVKCIKSLFGVDYLPQIDLSLKEIPLKAQIMAGKMSISGVQVKLSLKLNRKARQLEVVPTGGQYILKPQVNEWPNIPENESLCMRIASNLGIDVPLSILTRLKDGTWAYIVKRFDRVKGAKRHQEDFCQILQETDKYKGSCEQVAGKIKEISVFPGLDLQLFFERLLFFYLIGNGDAHLKNFSVVYDDKGRPRLSPAYDIASSRLVIPDEEDFALPINGRRNNLKRSDFDVFADRFNIRADVCYKNILKKEIVDELISASELPEETMKRLLEIVEKRFEMMRK